MYPVIGAGMWCSGELPLEMPTFHVRALGTGSTDSDMKIKRDSIGRSILTCFLDCLVCKQRSEWALGRSGRKLSSFYQQAQSPSEHVLYMLGKQWQVTPVAEAAWTRRAVSCDGRWGQRCRCITGLFLLTLSMKGNHQRDLNNVITRSDLLPDTV